MPKPEIVKIEISIASQRIPLSVDIDTVGAIRDVEAQIDALFRRWRKDFPAKSEKELLAMMAYQYASYYRELTIRYKEAAAQAQACDSELDRLLDSHPELDRPS